MSPGTQPLAHMDACIGLHAVDLQASYRHEKPLILLKPLKPSAPRLAFAYDTPPYSREQPSLVFVSPAARCSLPPSYLKRKYSDIQWSALTAKDLAFLGIYPLVDWRMRHLRQSPRVDVLSRLLSGVLGTADMVHSSKYKLSI